MAIVADGDKGKGSLKPKVLIFSDDGKVVSPLEEKLTGVGITPVRLDALHLCPDLLQSGCYHLILIDMDGCGEEAMDLIQTTRKSFPFVSVIVVSSSPSIPRLIGLLRAGIYDFFPKPVESEALFSTICSVCRKRVIREVNAEVLSKLHSSNILLDKRQVELTREIFRINEELRVLNKALKKHVSQLTVLYQMGRDISGNENWSDALDRFLMALVKYMQADGAALLLFSQEERVLSPRSNFQVEEGTIEEACRLIVSGWKKHPRGSEIHALEGYRDGALQACLERISRWRISVIPLRHRNRALGFILLEKEYAGAHAFRIDYHFLNTIQTIFAEEVANASYISELRQLGRFNERVLDNINSGVITTDLEGSVRFFNKQASILCTNLRKPEGVHFDSLFRSKKFGSGFFRQIIQSRKESHVLEVDCLRGGGSSFPARLSTSKMFDDVLGGDVVVAIFEDLTDQKRLEAEVRRNDRLRILGQLSAGVAHEIRNPLTGIATSAEVLAAKLRGEEEKAKYIRAILDEINRLDGIIKSLLEFARPAKPNLRDCSLPEIAERVSKLLSDQARKRGIALRFVDKLKIDVFHADADQITQVLLNIVLNALEACGEGDRIDVILENTIGGDGKDYVRIDVIDNGPGVPADIRESLFEPFVTTKAKGTGLGLAISQHIVEEHQGRISCEFPEKGTKFSLLLPIHRLKSAVGESHP